MSYTADVNIAVTLNSDKNISHKYKFFVSGNDFEEIQRKVIALKAQIQTSTRYNGGAVTIDESYTDDCITSNK